MIKVSYNQEPGKEVTFMYPQVEISFETSESFSSIECDECEVTFCPETLGDPSEWQSLIDSISSKTKYSIESCGTNSDYTVSHSNGSLTISIGAYGSGTVGSLTVKLPTSPTNLSLLEKIKTVAQCVVDNVEYIDTDVEQLAKPVVVSDLDD